MADGKKPEIDSLLFAQLVMSFQAAALQQMGKAPNPITGKTERNLEIAKNSVDILGMMETKTKGNLTDDEKNFLQHTLTQLRMTYVEEANKPASSDNNNPEANDDK